MSRISWAPILAHARGIIQSYDTGVTLRQLFYRLVADETLPNIQSYYRRLSSQTAEVRRTGGFPDLLDRTSRIERYQSFDGPAAALDWLWDIYRRDRAEGQPWTIYLGVEKASLSAQLMAWFGGPFGFPVVALGGYASQTLADKVRRDIKRQGRPSVLIYGGDLDPTGEDIDRDFVGRVRVFDKVLRVALSEDQVLGDFGPDEDPGPRLPFNPSPDVVAKLNRDSRAAAFLERHQAFLDEHYDGDIVQFEVDALPPDRLRNLYQNAIDQFWDDDVYAEMKSHQKADLKELRKAAKRFRRNSESS